MGKLVGYARVSTRAQDSDRQVADLLAAGVRSDDLCVDHSVSGAHARRPRFDKALEALGTGDTLIVTTLDRLGRSISNMLTLAEELRARGVNLRVLNLGGRRTIFSDSQIAAARRLIEQGQPASHVARDLGMSRATVYRRMAHLDAQQWFAMHQGQTGV